MIPVLLGGIYLGWALGSNDAANVFGTAVACRVIPFRRAAFLCAVAVIVGAYLQGERGIQTLSELTSQTTGTLLIVSVSAAVVVTIMTFLRLPISTSQAVVGAITGIGIVNRNMQWDLMVKVVMSWISTPLGAMLFAMIFYRLLKVIFRYIPMGILTRDNLLLSGLVVVGIYGSYALGANNVANVTGIYSGQIPGLTDSHLALIGGGAIAFGVITFGKRVMLAVGSSIVLLNAQTAFVAVLSMAVTVHIFALIGVPVSTSQGIVGSVIGIGIMHGAHTVKFKTVRNIGIGWVLTPLSALILSAAGYALFGQSI